MANGILGKKVRNYVYIPRPKFPFQITLTGRELAAWTGGGAALEFTANPEGQPCSPSWPTVALESDLQTTVGSVQFRGQTLQQSRSG